MKKLLKKLVLLLVLALAAFLYYYVALPAFNIHSIETWFFLIVGCWYSFFRFGNLIFPEKERFNIMIKRALALRRQAWRYWG